MVAPASRMAPADDLENAAKTSPLWARYGTRSEAESAREKLAARVASAAEQKPAAETTKPKAEHREAAKAAGGGAGAVGDFLKSRQGKAIQRQVVRGVFGMLKKKF
jgi:hypothetical protein